MGLGASTANSESDADLTFTSKEKPQAFSSIGESQSREVTARDDAGVFEELPGGVELASSASVPLGVEARVLGAQGEGDGAVRGDAEAVGGSRGGPEGPAAAAVGLVADVADDLGTLGEGGDGVELVGDGIFVTGEEGCMDKEIIIHVIGTGLEHSVRVLD